MDITHLFYISAFLLSVSSVFGWANTRWFHLPHSIALVISALSISLVLIIADYFFAGGLAASLRGTINQIHFDETLMIGMLSFLLFAGALHVDLELLLKHKWTVLAMATIGVFLSTFIIGFGTYYLLNLIGFPIGVPWCLVLGALISPTDPVAVLSILKKVELSPALEVKIAGESLFNDGVGVVVFMVMLSIALSPDTPLSFSHIGQLFALEVLGGIAIGLGGGYIAFLAMRGIDDYSVEILISLALVMGSYSLALWLHASGPIAVVIAGLITGNHGHKFAMSEKTREHLSIFWTVLDDILNSVLFLLIGFEVLLLGFDWRLLSVIALMLPLLLFARFFSVCIPIFLTSKAKDRPAGTIRILTWAGLRGGISIALALSLPAFEGREIIIVVTYGVVVCSILIQGLSIERLSNYWAK